MLKLKIVSPEKIVFNGDVDGVIVPGTSGQFEILDHHAPIISSLEKGVVTYKAGADTVSVEVLGGFVSVKKNEVNVCVEI